MPALLRVVDKRLLVGELSHRHPLSATLPAFSHNIAALAAKRVTTTVPIVFATGSDPVSDGLVFTFGRKGPYLAFKKSLKRRPRV
jgi:ABC-type uncharacterized transport system substrate-binding protein